MSDLLSGGQGRSVQSIADDALNLAVAIVALAVIVILA